MSGRYVSRARAQQERLAAQADRSTPVDRETMNRCLGIVFTALRPRLGNALIAHAQPGEIWTDAGVKHNILISRGGQQYMILITFGNETGGNVIQLDRGDVYLGRDQKMDEDVLDEVVRKLTTGK